MRITFTGKQEELNPKQERKLATQFLKLSKLLEQRGEKAAQVALSTQRHLQMAEVRINVYGQTLVAMGSGPDQFTAISQAAERVEHQALKLRSKFRHSKRETPTRVARTQILPEALPAPAPPEDEEKKDKRRKPAAKAGRPSRVVRAEGKQSGKPMTVDEAMLALEDDRDYMVYRDAETGGVSVLIRRRDGKVDLIEA
jgi:putative sigma-54 modulation protein